MLISDVGEVAERRAEVDEQRGILLSLFAKM